MRWSHDEPAETGVPRSSSGGPDDGPPPLDDVTLAPPRARSVAVLRWLMLLGMVALAGLGLSRAVSHHSASDASGPAAAAFSCPMHPQVVAATPATCPVCNMRLEPVAASESAAASRRAPGLQTAAAVLAPLAATVEVRAQIAAHERRLVQVTGRYTGWIETLSVPGVGGRVERGQVLATVYSPDLIRAQKTLLNARRWQRTGEPNIQPTDRGDSNGDMFEEARFRVEAFGIDPRDIDTILKQGTMRAVPIRAPARGHLIRNDVVNGGYVQAGLPLFTIADLDTVSVVGEILESDIDTIGAVGAMVIGQPARVTVRAFPGEEFTATLRTIEPVVGETTGTVRIRADLANPGLRLRPGLSGQLRIALPARQALVVPPQSVVATQQGPVVFVAGPDQSFRRAPVRLGARTRDAVEILSGLEAGAVVATDATILLEAGESSGRKDPP